MKYEFDKPTKPQELTTQNLRYLHACDVRISGVQARVDTPERLDEDVSGDWNGPVNTQEDADVEIARLTVARKDIASRLTKKEKEEYERFIEAIKSRMLTPEEQKALAKRLDENKDSVSI